MNLPAAMAEYMNAGGMGPESLKNGGELPLVFDEALRVRLVPMADGRVALESRVRAVPEDGGERDKMVERALKLSLGRMQDHGESLTMTEDRQAFRVQSLLPAAASRADLEAVLETHLNALSYWRSALV